MKIDHFRSELQLPFTLKQSTTFIASHDINIIFIYYQYLNNISIISNVVRGYNCKCIELREINIYILWYNNSFV